MDGYISKPFSKEKLRDAVMRFVPEPASGWPIPASSTGGTTSTYNDSGYPNSLSGIGAYHSGGSGEAGSSTAAFKLPISPPLPHQEPQLHKQSAVSDMSVCYKPPVSSTSISIAAPLFKSTAEGAGDAQIPQLQILVSQQPEVAASTLAVSEA
jgi:hypothetical protein